MLIMVDKVCKAFLSGTVDQLEFTDRDKEVSQGLCKLVERELKAIDEMQR
jgi:hypothetical protein